MTNYEKLVEALRCGEYKPECGSSDCPYWSGLGCMDGQLMEDAAAAIEALQAQLPKRGEIVRCGECAHCYAEGFVHERNICEKHPELGNVPDDWFCADGEREVQE